MHTLAWPVENVPAPHPLQFTFPVVLVYVPDAHALQLDGLGAPITVEYVPVPQSVQILELRAPCPVPYFPATQNWQALVPV